MRRPWELAHADRRGGPRVYVPVSLPDTPSATFAVLELVGFSSSPSSTPHQADTLLSLPLHSPSHPLFAALHEAPPPSLPPHLESSLQSSHTPPLVSDVDHPPTIANIAAVAPTTSFTPRDPKKLPTPPLAIIADEKSPIVKTAIKENVVHTTSLNFKDVVQKLTGASSKVEGMHPATLPSRGVASPPIANGAGKSLITSYKVLDALSVRMDSHKALKRSSSCKLLERRKGSLYNLEQLHTDKTTTLLTSTLTSLSQSPITPLTSYFEKFCNAMTPTPSPSSNLSSSPSRQSIPEPELSSMPIIVNDCASLSSICGASKITKQQCASPSQPLCGPPLLSLFPESPISSSQHL